MSKVLFIGLGLMLPVFVSAQAQTSNGFKDLLVGFGGLVSLLLPVAFGLAVLFFFWGLAKFILKSGSEESRDEGKQVMFWGIIALFVLVSIWGIVGFIAREFKINIGAEIQFPSL